MSHFTPYNSSEACVTWIAGSSPYLSWADSLVALKMEVGAVHAALASHVTKESPACSKAAVITVSGSLKPA